MATLDKTTVRNEIDRLKTDFEQLRADGKATAESLAVMNNLFRRAFSHSQYAGHQTKHTLVTKVLEFITVKDTLIKSQRKPEPNPVLKKMYCCELRPSGSRTF